MTRTRFPNGVSSFGVPVLSGSQVPATTGDFYFVHNSDGSDDNLGEDPSFPKATLGAAVNASTANNGDVIILMPGHSESISSAGAVDLDVAGLTVVGLGFGDDRPTLTFDSDTGADMDVDADDITMSNIRFVGGIDALTGPIDVNNDNFTLKNSQWEDSTGQVTDCIIVDGDDFTLENWRHFGATGAGSESAIQLNGVSNPTLKQLWIDGNFGTACIESTSANTGITINGGGEYTYLRTRNSTDALISLQSTDAGFIGPEIYGRLADDAANITEAIDTADVQFFDPIHIVNADGERGMQWNATQSADA